MKMFRAIFLITLAVFIQACETTTPKSPFPRDAGTPPPSAPVTAAPAAPRPSAPAVSAQTPAPADTKAADLKGSTFSTAPSKTPPLPSIAGKITTGLLHPPTPDKPDKSPVAEGEKQRVVFNFDKADLSEVTSQIFGEYLKLSYVIDPTLQGRISLYLEGDFTKDELFQMVSKAYLANSISITPRQGIHYIQALQKSAGNSLPIATNLVLEKGRDGAKAVIVMYRLKFMDAKQALNTVKFFLTPGRPIAPDTLTNTLIFIEDTENAKTIVDVLRTLDINLLQEVNMEVVPLKSIAPQDAVQSMEALMGKLGMFKDSAIKTNLAFIPLLNFGGVLVLAQTPDLLKTAKAWIEALDVHGQEAGDQIYVYFVKNALAIDIADILNQVYGLGGGAGGGSKRLDQQVVGGTRSTFGGTSGFGRSSGFGSGGSSSSGSRSFGSSYSGSSSDRSLSSSSAGGSYSGSSGSMFGGSSGSRTSGFGGTSGSTSRTRGAAGGYARGGVAGGGAPSTTLSGEVVIIPDEVNNAIVMRANAADYAKIKKTIDALDIVPRAVLIEVMIAEVTLTKDLQYGLKWYLENLAVDSGGLFGSFKGLKEGDMGSLEAAGAAVAAASGTGGALGWVSNSKNVGVLLNLIGSKTKVKILSNPTLLATDNKEASIQVGGREPVPTGSYTGGTGSTGVGDIFSTISYEETGVILNVIPHINAGGLVRLEVDQTIRRTGADKEVGVGNTAPTFTERNIKTTLLAQDGTTVIIGGIIDDNDKVGKSGIPGLMDVPIVSPLFSTSSRSRDRLELLIAITPHVVEHRDSDSTKEFLEKLRMLRANPGR